MSRAARACVALLAATLSSGCAHLRVGTDGLTFDARRARIEAVSTWDARGRLAIDNGSDAVQTRFRWHQDGESLELIVFRPVGGVLLRVSGSPDNLMLEARGQPPRALVDPEAELLASEGWWVPVLSVRSWLLGFPDDDFRADVERGTDGTLARLSQRLWDVSYPSYQLMAAADGDVLVPREIELTHANLELIVTLDEWGPGEPRTP